MGRRRGVVRGRRRDDDPAADARATRARERDFSVHEVAQFAYLAGGTAPLKTGTVIQKLFRDVHAGTQHISSGPIMRRNTGLGLLGHVADDKVWAFAEMVPSSAV